MAEFQGRIRPSLSAQEVEEISAYDEAAIDLQEEEIMEANQADQTDQAGQAEEAEAAIPLME